MKLEGKLKAKYYEGIVREYYEDGKLLFEGEYSYWSRRNGKIFDKDGEVIDEIKEGKSSKEENEELKI